MRLKRSVKEILHRLKICLPWISYESKYRFAEVDHDKLFRSSQPTTLALDYFITHYHVHALIILREKGNEKEIAYAKSHGLNICHISIKHDAPPKKNDIQKFFDFLSDKNNNPALIHCLQGRDRTGCLCLIYRIEKMGWTTDDAWQEMKKFGFFSLPWHDRTQGHIKAWLEQRYGRA